MTMQRPEWVKLVGEWRRSGRSAREFAARNGVTGTALRYWGGRLTEDEDVREPESSQRARERAPATSGSVALARVVRQGEAPARRITVVIGKAAIVVEPGFDDAHLRAVVRALGEAG